MAGFVSPIDGYSCRGLSDDGQFSFPVFKQEFEYRDSEIPWFLQRAAVRLGVDVRCLGWSIQKAVYKPESEQEVGDFIFKVESNQLILPLMVSIGANHLSNGEGSFHIYLEDSSLHTFSYNCVRGMIGTIAEMYISDAVVPPEGYEHIVRVFDKAEGASVLSPYIEGKKESSALSQVYTQRGSIIRCSGNSLPESESDMVHIVHSGGLCKTLANYFRAGVKGARIDVYFEYMLITANQ